MQQQRGFLVLDFGSQFTQLIARRLRELGFYSEIHPFDFSLQKIKELNPLGIILSGGPHSVYEAESPRRSVAELQSVAPILGICYGMQLVAAELGGKVQKSSVREYGQREVKWQRSFGAIPQSQKVWMSHGDVVTEPPSGFEVLATTDDHLSVMLGPQILCLQFHPEVAHTEYGIDLIKYFTQEMCGAVADWKAPHIVASLQEKIREAAGAQDHVLCALSGGVDSTVVAVLLTKTLGPERVHCIFVNNGLLRKGEFEMVMENYQDMGLNILGVDAKDDFLTALAGHSDPEIKRKTIGRVFIEVFERYLPRLPLVKWLAQGTLYPDVVESISMRGANVTIKSHHNVGGLPERMKLKLLEPVRDLFKDEVRLIGKELGIKAELLSRHPFPGPGLGIRILGDITLEKLEIMREADAIFIEFLKEKNLYHKIWQAFCVLLPIHSVGVQGDGRTYERVLALRAVTSLDGMTADWYPFSFEELREVSNRITNRVRGVNRVVYDVTSKPPGTIEWE